MKNLGANIHDLAKRHPTLPFILWFIGVPAKEITWKNYITGKEKTYKKAHDAQATSSEINHYLKKCAQIEKGVSRSMVHHLLGKMESKLGLIKTVGSKEKGKAVTYTLTELGREAQHILALYNDLKIKVGETSGVLGHDKNTKGELYFIPMIQIKKREDVELISKAMKYVNEKRQADKFLNDIIEMQRMAILLYCSNLVNSSVSLAAKELLSEQSLMKMPKIILDFFKQLSD